MAMKQEFDVYISYSRKDGAFVRRLAESLEAEGLNVWWDVTDLKGGEDWSRAIQQALEASQNVLVVLSPNAVESEWVQKEYTLALSRRKKVIPILIEASQVPFALNTINYVDFTRADYETALDNLLVALEVREANSTVRQNVSSRRRKAQNQTSDSAIADDDEEDDTQPKQKTTTTRRPSEPTKAVYSAETAINGVQLQVTVSSLGWRLPGVDGLLLRRDERPEAWRPAGAFYHDLMNDMRDPSAANNLTALLSESLKTQPVTQQTPAHVLLPPALGQIVLPFSDPNPAHVILTAVRAEDSTPTPDAIKTMFQNAIALAGRNSIQHLATPIYFATGFGENATKTALNQMLDAVQEIKDFGSLKQITILSLGPEIVDVAKERFNAKPIDKAPQPQYAYHPQTMFNDQPKGEDKLGIAAEVNALTDAILLRDVEPPLAVGVMGGWGSGKSFVLYLIQRRIIETRAKKIKKGWPDPDKQKVNEKDPQVPLHAGHIYQIHFNAWTYAKSNLWASLMQTIFFELNKQMRYEQLLAHKDFVPPFESPTGEQVLKEMPEGSDKTAVKQIYDELAKSTLRPSLQDVLANLPEHMDKKTIENIYAKLAENAKPPTADAIRAKMRESLDKKVVEKIYADNLQIEQDEVLKPWRDNLTYWGRNLLNESLLWHVMRKQQAETLNDLRNTEEQVKKLKDQRETFEQKRKQENRTIELSEPAAQRAYYQMVKTTALGYVSEEVNKKIDQELKERGVPKEDAKALHAETRKVLLGPEGFLQALKTNQAYKLAALVLAIITFALPYTWTAFGAVAINKVAAQGVSLFMVAAPILSTVLTWLQKATNFLNESKQALNSAYEIEQAKTAEAIYSSEATTFSEKVTALQLQISKNNRAAYDLLITLMETHVEEQRRQIGPSAKYASLLEFVESRLDAGSYENQLGLMHQVRQDIDELTYSLVENTDPTVFPRGKPRIIIYIDDLDRCPPPRVVEVLEAVQLLLNTKLFVVVLGLDTRYVTRALEKEYKEILQHEGDPSGLDYIEKIVQIPYRVRPIEPNGLKMYLEGQMEIEQPPATTGRAPAIAPDGFVEDTANIVSNNGHSPTTEEETEETAEEEIQSDEAGKTQPEKNEAPVEPEITEAVLQFKPEDLEDLNACCEKIALTPRSIKRLVNVLKLMKIFWFNAGKEEQSRLVKQATISMLALSAAYPEVMREAFSAVENAYYIGETGSDLLEVLNTVRLPSSVIEEIAWQLEKHQRDLKALRGISDNFAQVSLAELKLANFNLVRSFSFVGDPVYWTDRTMAAEIREHRSEPSNKTNRN